VLPVQFGSHTHSQLVPLNCKYLPPGGTHFGGSVAVSKASSRVFSGSSSGRGNSVEAMTSPSHRRDYPRKRAESRGRLALVLCSTQIFFRSESAEDQFP
jgi:hypothetical protein